MKRCLLSLVAAWSLVLLLGCGGDDGGSGGGNGQGGTTVAKVAIKVVAFDEDDETLQAILDGECFGTVVQNPYMYGYESVRLLAELEKGNESALPEDGFKDFPVRMIKAAEAEDFWKEKKANLESGAGDAEQKADRPTVAFVTNGIDPFWLIAAAGAKAAAKKANVNVLLRYPPEGVADQNQMIQALIVQDEVSGVAVSPIDAENQVEALDKLGEAKHFITHDSDAPASNRKAYIGTLNYKAGRVCGEMVKEALPEGGSIMIFVGRLGQLNAEQRRQGLIDELLDRGFDPTRRDPVDKVIAGNKYSILGTMTDNFDKPKAKQNAQDAISANPDLGCMVGLFAYNPPMCLQAVREAGREVRPQ